MPETSLGCETTYMASALYPLRKRKPADGNKARRFSTQQLLCTGLLSSVDPPKAEPNHSPANARMGTSSVRSLPQNIGLGV